MIETPSQPPEPPSSPESLSDDVGWIIEIVFAWKLIRLYVCRNYHRGRALNAEVEAEKLVYIAKFTEGCRPTGNVSTTSHSESSMPYSSLSTQTSSFSQYDAASMSSTII